MKVNIPIITNIGQDIKDTTVKVSKASKRGYDIGVRNSKIYNKSLPYRMYGIGKSVEKQIASETSIDDLPVVAGAIGMFVPLPLISPTMYVLGKAIQLGYKIFKK